jgi:uncharacterized membrane protein SirB2
MTTESAHSGDDPRRLLSSTRELAERVRKEQRATWFPLLVFAAVTFAAIPVLRYSGHHLGPCAATGPGLKVCTVYPNAQFVYWPIALVLAYVAIAAFYIHRSRVRGIETRVRPYAVAGIIIAVVLAGAALWLAHTTPSTSGRTLIGLTGFGHGLASEIPIGLALLVLAWAERNRALLLLTLAYLAVVLFPIPLRFSTAFWNLVPQLVTGGTVLLLGGIGFALAQRPLRSPAP